MALDWKQAARDRDIAVKPGESARQARCVETCLEWNERLRAGEDPDSSPLLATALTAGFRWLQVQCPNCRSVGEVDLAGLDRHPKTSIYGLVPSLSCRGCQNARSMPRLLGLSVVAMREIGVG
jgi:hypothetical protein